MFVRNDNLSHSFPPECMYNICYMESAEVLLAFLIMDFSLCNLVDARRISRNLFLRRNINGWGNNTDELGPIVRVHFSNGITVYSSSNFDLDSLTNSNNNNRSKNVYIFT